MRIATWNVNSILARLPRLTDWLAATAPDVLCLQETKCADEAFPVEPLAALGYEVAAHGDGRWNGVAILSRVGIADVSRGLPDQPPFPDGAPPEARAIVATCGPVRVWSVYVPNGREPDSPHYGYKLRWLAALRDAVRSDAAAVRSFGVLGDMNIAPTDADVWDPAAFIDSTHVTPAERAALAEVMATGLTDLTARPLKHDHPFTYWDYRAGNFHKNLGMRIDLVLANRAFSAAVEDAYVDREARKGRGPSDHAPVVVDLDILRLGQRAVSA